ncbi:fido (protein-threonine AMPylation protein) [Ensifer adhaerens]|uniref:Fido (Protein-threonine AMPylation protein) n=1 Tax=Ensifer adhaerens TaxID=106592 RepID=A0ACC5SXK9_ENSAD|nr:Fic family protein [Ensifer adhaerens]MBP1873570.1 fido (protein-threonine AMPylation protein) [Ensifer adhaerens]
MILFEITRNEQHPAYQRLEIENGLRHYDFLRSMVVASLDMGRPFLSQQIMKALNFHAIACLHTHAGEYRPCPVRVGEYHPPQHYQVVPLMDDFVNMVNRSWQATDPVAMAAFVLWRLNHIHPFINGNGRTARAAAYFVLCVSAGSWLPGETILPELLRQERAEYVVALQRADAAFDERGEPDLGPLHEMLSRLLSQQLQSAGLQPDEGDGSEEGPAEQEVAVEPAELELAADANVEGANDNPLT